MKKIFIYLITFSFVFNLSIAKDRNFQLITTSNNASFFLDIDSVKRANNNPKDPVLEIKWIELVSYNKPQTTDSGKKFHSLQLYKKGKCIGNQSKIYMFQSYDKKMHDGNVMKGNIVDTFMNYEEDWTTRKEGTAGYVILIKACQQIIKNAAKKFHERNKKKN